jgi:hypothetical protein
MVTDLRDWPNVTLADARDAAASLGWTERLEAMAEVEAKRSASTYRQSFIFYLLNAIDGALRAGTAWEDFPEEARSFYLSALSDAGADLASPWVRPEDL